MSNGVAFTLKSTKGLLKSLVTKCGACQAFDPTCGEKHPEVHNFQGLWDTGATGTVITREVAERLNLQPISKAKVFHADGESIVNVYAINIFLPNGLGFKFIRVTEGKLTGTDILIGMDIICQGDFSITNVAGNTVFSFRVPSATEIDYVDEANKANKANKANIPEARASRGSNFTPPKKKRKKR